MPPSLLVDRKDKVSNDAGRIHMKKMGSTYGGLLTIITVVLSMGIFGYLIEQMSNPKFDIIQKNQKPNPMDSLEIKEVSMVGNSSYFMPSIQISLLGNNI
jgi:hypothetical protein